jgi:hypothetical protein
MADLKAYSTLTGNLVSNQHLNQHQDKDYLGFQLGITQ